MEMVTWNHDGYFIRHGHDYFLAKYSLTRSELFLGQYCTSSVHIKTEEAALTLSRSG